jgi:PAS domain S-box-containing protein
MNPARHRTVVVVLISFLAVGGWAMDMFRPLGMAGWIWYCIPLLLSFYVGGRYASFLLAAVFSVLTLAGYCLFYLSSPEIDAGAAFISRMRGIGLFWVMAFLIWQRKRMELALRMRESFLSAITENQPGLLWLKDTEGRFLMVNKAFAKACGRSDPEKVHGLTDLDVWPKELAEKYRNDDQRVMSTGNAIAEEEMIFIGDSHVWFETFKTPVHDDKGRVIGTTGYARDITGRKQAEAELHKSETQLQSVLESTGDGILAVDNEGKRIIKANRRFAEMWRIPQSIIDAGDNHALLNFVLEQLSDPDAFLKNVRSLFGMDTVTVNTLDFKDGRIFERHGFPMLMDGVVIGRVWSFRDITGRKRVEAELDKERDLVRRLLDNSLDNIYFKDTQSRFIKVSKTQARFFGVESPDALVGKTDFDFCKEADARSRFEDEQEIIRTGRPMIAKEEWEERKPGHVTWVSSTKMPLRDETGKIIGIMGISRDITERKRVEQQLMEKFNFNWKIISDAPTGIVVFKASGPCVFANETAAQALNATVSQILKQDFRHIASWPASGMLQTAEETLATKEPRQCESHFVTTFGKEVWLVCHFSHFVQNDEPHLLLVFSDFTERKKLEAQLLRAQRMESIGTLAGGIAHDLNNVLTPLLLSVQILKEKISDADGQNTLKILEANVVRGANLVKQVLAFGRGIHGERIMVQPKHIGREIEHIVLETFPKSVAFEFHSPADLWSITGDPTQIEQVLLNLCLNARDAMPGGGILSIRMENRLLGKADTATNLDAKPGRHVVISVTDTGEGMTRETQDRIFEPFFTTKEQGKGTGLGLSTTLAIVKSHGGFINCYSEPGKGSVFKVYLPASSGPAVTDKPASDQSTLPCGHNELVLVVDDEEPIRKLAQTMLERFDYRVLLAANGAEAVKLYASRGNEIAVVITDMAMPVMDGHATIAALQAINPKVKVIGSSGMNMNDSSTGAINPAIRHFMTKPYTLESMLNILHEVLQENPVK